MLVTLEILTILFNSMKSMIGFSVVKNILLLEVANPKVTKSISKQVIGDLDLEEWEELKLRWEQYIVAIKKTKTYELSFKGFKKSGSIEVLTFHPSNLPPLYHDVWFVKKWIQAEEMDKGNYGERMYLALITRLQVNWSHGTGTMKMIGI